MWGSFLLLCLCAGADVADKVRLIPYTLVAVLHLLTVLFLSDGKQKGRQQMDTATFQLIRKAGRSLKTRVSYWIWRFDLWTRDTLSRFVWISVSLMFLHSVGSTHWCIRINLPPRCCWSQRWTYLTDINAHQLKTAFCICSWHRGQRQTHLHPQTAHKHHTDSG